MQWVDSLCNDTSWVSTSFFISFCDVKFKLLSMHQKYCTVPVDRQ